MWFTASRSPDGEMSGSKRAVSEMTLYRPEATDLASGQVAATCTAATAIPGDPAMSPRPAAIDDRGAEGFLSFCGKLRPTTNAAQGLL